MSHELPFPAPGNDSTWYNSWVFPILVPDRKALRQAMLAGGFDATEGKQSMAVIGDAPSRTDLPVARKIHAETLYLPSIRNLNGRQTQKILRILREFATPTNRN